MRKILIIILLFLLPQIMKSQTATATIEDLSSCAGDTVLVPVNVTDFNNIGAMTIFVGYDTLTAEFLSLENVNPAIPGFLTVNANNSQVGIAYSNISGFTIDSGKIFDLKYELTGSASLLTFNPGTEIANTNLEVIPLDTNNGSLNNAITIIAQPDSAQAYPDTDVQFTILATGNSIAYQWEENSGSGWISLSNNTTYSGVETETLTIHDVPLSMDGNEYRCLLSAGDCAIYSGIALLEVNTAYPAATIGQVSSCPEETIMDPIFVGDFFDVIEFTFNITYSGNVLEFISLMNVLPELQAGSLTTTPMTSPNGIIIHWFNNDPISITSGKLFDIEFNHLASNSDVSFYSGTVVLNSLSNPVDITLTDGFVYQYELPVILTQPESQTVKVNQQGIFAVEATGTVAYQWQVSTDGGVNWTTLSNSTPYYNVTTNELTIDPVSWDLNEYQYACILYGDHCDLMTDAAVLNVDTLTWTGKELLTSGAGLKLNPNPTGDHVTLTYSSKGSCNTEIKVLTLSGNLLMDYPLLSSQAGENNAVIDLSTLRPGLYLIEIHLEGQEGKSILRAKLIKI